MWVICAAAAVGVVGVALLRRSGARPLLLRGTTMDLQGKPMTRTLPLGAVLLGLGWGLAGACPGTVMVMLGEGKLGSIFTIAGIVLGTYAYGRRHGGAATGC
jgi:uncharacterized membrane protein YedE/YeeE